LLGLYLIMAIVSGAAALGSSHIVVTVWLLVCVFFTGMNRPMLESLCSESRNPQEMSRRVGTYNLTWATSGAAALFITGTLIERWRSGIFLLPMLMDGLCAVVMVVLLIRQPVEPERGAAHLEPEPDLVRARTLALWLS